MFPSSSSYSSSSSSVGLTILQITSETPAASRTIRQYVRRLELQEVLSHPELQINKGFKIGPFARRSR